MRGAVKSPCKCQKTAITHNKKQVSQKSLQNSTISGTCYDLDRRSNRSPTGQKAGPQVPSAKTPKTQETPCREFQVVRDFGSRFTVMPDEERDIWTVWQMTTWTFSPMCQWPATFPYILLTGPAGSGKTVSGQDVAGVTCRMWRSAAGATGPTLFRMLGREDEETGEIENFAPTLFLDEIDSTYSGSKDEPHRLSLNVGYKRGATIPRSAGKTSIDFPVYGPKILGGIDNGHLPETVSQRCIRIELEKFTQDELDAMGIEPFYTFDVEDERDEIQQMLSDWAKRESMVLRDYRPKAPKGLTARQWEIARTLVQMAHAIGIEQRIVRALVTVFGRKRAQDNAKQRLYMAIKGHFEATGLDRVISRDLQAHLDAHGIAYPGNSGKGLASILGKDGISPQSIWVVDTENPKGKSHRGYFLRQFDRAFVDHLPDEDDD